MASLGPQQDLMQLREQLMQQLGYTQPGVEDPKAKRAREYSHALRAETPGTREYSHRAQETLGEDIGDVWNTPIPGSKTAMQGFDKLPWAPHTLAPKLAAKMFPEGTTVGDAAEVFPGIGEASDAYYLQDAAKTGNWGQGTLAAAGLALPFVSGRQLSNAGEAGANMISDALRYTGELTEGLRGVDAPSSPLPRAPETSVAPEDEGLTIEIGGPERMYHMTRHDFDEFGNPEGSALGTHFGTEQAAKDMTGKYEELPAGARTIPAEVDVKNPVDLPFDTGFYDPQITLMYMRDFGRSTSRQGELQYPHLNELADDAEALMKKPDLTMDDVKKMLEEKGYDGIRYTNTSEDPGSKSVIAFDNSQIRNPMGEGPQPRVALGEAKEIGQLARALRGEEVIGGSRTEPGRPDDYRTAALRRAEDVLGRPRTEPGAGIQDVIEGREMPTNRKRVADMTDEELAAFGDQYGVNLRLTPPEKVIDPDSGAEYLIPGGLDRNKPFTLADQMFLKSQAYNAKEMNPQLQTQLQRKMLDATTPKATGTGSLDDPATMFNRIMFGMQSPNTPLLTNQFMTTRMRVQTPEDIKALGDMIDWEPGAKVDKARRMKADHAIGEKFGIHAAGKGGMGMRSSVDLTNIAEFAKLYSRHPEFFQRKADEPWQHFAERILNVQRGLSPKTASFGAVWQAPGEATISAMDRHMARNFRDVLMNDKTEGPKIRKQRVKLWNEQIDRIPEMDQKVADAEKKAKAKPTAQNKAALKRAKDNRDKLPPEGTKKVKSYNAILKQPGGEAWDADQIIVDSTKHVGGKYRLKNGEINPNVPEHLRDLPIEPETFLSFGPTYTRMLQENERLAKEQGLDVFGEQWRFWDRIREQVEPHEAMNPDIQKLPRMPAEELNEAFKHQKQAGFHTSGRKTTGERYVSPFDWKKGIAFSAAGALPLSYALRQQRENEEEVY